MALWLWSSMVVFCKLLSLNPNASTGDIYFFVFLLVLAGKVFFFFSPTEKRLYTNKKEVVCSRSMLQDTRSIWRLGAGALRPDRKPSAETRGHFLDQMALVPPSCWGSTIWKRFFSVTTASCFFFFVLFFCALIHLSQVKSRGLLFSFLFIACIHWNEMCVVRTVTLNQTP